MFAVQVLGSKLKHFHETLRTEHPNCGLYMKLAWLQCIESGICAFASCNPELAATADAIWLRIHIGPWSEEALVSIRGQRLYPAILRQTHTIPTGLLFASLCNDFSLMHAFRTARSGAAGVPRWGCASAKTTC